MSHGTRNLPTSTQDYSQESLNADDSHNNIHKAEEEKKKEEKYKREGKEN